MTKHAKPKQNRRNNRRSNKRKYRRNKTRISSNVRTLKTKCLRVSQQNKDIRKTSNHNQAIRWTSTHEVDQGNISR